MPAVLDQAQTARLDHRLRQRHGLRDDRRQVERLDGDLHLADFDARHVQQIIDHPQQVVAGPPDLARPAELLGRWGRHLDDLRKAQDGVQRRAQFMTHVREELALGPVRVLGTFDSLAQRGGAFTHTRLQAAVQVANRQLGSLLVADVHRCQCHARDTAVPQDRRNCGDVGPGRSGRVGNRVLESLRLCVGEGAFDGLGHALLEFGWESVDQQRTFGQRVGQVRKGAVGEDDATVAVDLVDEGGGFACQRLQSFTRLAQSFMGIPQ